MTIRKSAQPRSGGDPEFAWADLYAHEWISMPSSARSAAPTHILRPALFEVVARRVGFSWRP